MSDEKFTKIASSFLATTRELVNWGIAGDHTTADELRLEIATKRAQIKPLHEAGLSEREISLVTCGSREWREQVSGMLGREEIENHGRTMLP